MKMKSKTAFLGLLAALCIGVFGAMHAIQLQAQARTVEGPIFEVDPLWPKPLPNHWLLGMAIGVWVDEKDHVWIIHRGASTLHANELALTEKVGECCAAAPPEIGRAHV